MRFVQMIAAAVAAFLSIAPAVPVATADGEEPASLFDPWDQIGAAAWRPGL